MWRRPRLRVAFGTAALAVLGVSVPAIAGPVVPLPPTVPSVPSVPTVPAVPSVPGVGGSPPTSLAPGVPGIPVPAPVISPVTAGSAGPACPSSPTAPAPGLDPNGPTGMDTEQACPTYTTGEPQVVVAYVEGGINWHLAEARQLVDHIYVNWHEAPVPCTGPSPATATMTVDGAVEPCRTLYSGSSADYDLDHDGVVDAGEWAHDPRVLDANGNGYVDPEDLMAAFCGPGYAPPVDAATGERCDISGWNFYRGDEDPATADATYTHSDDQMLNIAAYCPRCMIMPVKSSAEAIAPTDDLAESWLFACESGASVVDSVTADLGYSSFMREVVDYCWHKGVAMAEASNDFDSTDHQGGMFWPDVVPGNGAVPDMAGTAWTRSDYTSWGPHNLLTVAGAETTSQSTSVLGGLLGLLLSFGHEAAAEHLIPAPLTGPQAVQVLERSATPVTDPSLPWPGSPGAWNLQYGYGIPDLYRAMEQVAAGEVPPVASISTPAWYAVEDPTRAKTVAVTGTIEADSPATGFHWVLELGMGAQPTTWRTIGRGSGTGTLSGRLGTVQLSEIPRSLWGAPFRLSSTKELETTDSYAVTLRLQVTDAAGNVGIDRRAVNVVRDASWARRFPLALGSSGESQPALVDLQGRGHLDLVFATADGTVDAIDPATGRELPGWPVHSAPVTVPVAPGGVDPGYQAIVADVAVGDLRGNGHLSVVATTSSGQVYAWDARGELEAGWPKRLDTGIGPPALPRPALAYTRPAVEGALAAPVLVHLTGPSRELDVVQAGWDGYLHAFRPGGSDVAGWPVRAPIPPGASSPPPGYVTVDDQMLDATPTVAYLQGRGAPADLVEASQVSETRGSGLQPLPFAFVYAWDASGHVLPGWPVEVPGLVEDYDSALQFVLEGAGTAVAADVFGTGADEVELSASAGVPVLIDGAGHIVSSYASAAPGASGVLGAPLRPAGALSGAPTPDLPVAAASSGAFGKLGATLALATPETGGVSTVAALEEDNAGLAVRNQEVAYPAAGGTALPGWPAQRQGLDLFGAPVLAPVGDGSQMTVVDGGDSSAVQAYTATGSQAPGFPKWTTGWNYFAPSAGDLFSDGRTDLALATREGYLFVWRTGGKAAANTEWWRWHHDEYNSGNAGVDSRPPGPVRALSWSSGRRSISFVAPGDNWYVGTVASYRVTFWPGDTTRDVPARAGAGTRQRVMVPRGTRRVTVQPVDDSGLLGPARTV